MKKLLVIVLFASLTNLNFATAKDSIYEKDSIVLEEKAVDSETEIVSGEPAIQRVEEKEEEQKSEKSLQEQAEEIPVVFGQWWFWVGLFAVILFLKFVIFKK